MRSTSTEERNSLTVHGMHNASQGLHAYTFLLH